MFSMASERTAMSSCNLDHACAFCSLIEAGQLQQVCKLIQAEQGQCECQTNLAVYRLVRFYQRFLWESCHDDSLTRSQVWKSSHVYCSKTRTLVLEACSKLLAGGAPVNYTTGVETPLMAALSTCDEDLLWLMLDFKADVNQCDGQQDISPLGLAILLNQVNLVSILLKHGAKVNAVCCGSLVPIQLAMNKNTEVSELLIQYGADIHQLHSVSLNDRLFTSQSPLHVAILQKNVHLGRLLLEHGEDVNQTFNDTLESPILQAVQNLDLDMIDLLLEYGADLNRPNCEHHTPVGLALTMEDPIATAIAKKLILAGASASQKTRISYFQRTYSPLHIACFKGNLDFVRFLVEEVCMQIGFWDEEDEDMEASVAEEKGACGGAGCRSDSAPKSSTSKNSTSKSSHECYFKLLRRNKRFWGSTPSSSENVGTLRQSLGTTTNSTQPSHTLQGVTHGYHVRSEQSSSPRNQSNAAARVADVAPIADVRKSSEESAAGKDIAKDVVNSAKDFVNSAKDLGNSAKDLEKSAKSGGSSAMDRGSTAKNLGNSFKDEDKSLKDVEKSSLNSQGDRSSAQSDSVVGLQAGSITKRGRARSGNLCTNCWEKKDSFSAISQASSAQSTSMTAVNQEELPQHNNVLQFKATQTDIHCQQRQRNQQALELLGTPPEASAAETGTAASENPIFQKEFGFPGHDSMSTKAQEGHGKRKVVAEGAGRRSHNVARFLNQVGNDGSTALFMAVHVGNVELVDYLLRSGADPYFSCQHGNFFHAAILSQSVPLLNRALELGCNINEVNAFGNSPLTLLSRLDLPDACEVLVSHGADMNSRDCYGETPLMASVYFGCEMNARILIQHGAALDLVDESDTSAIYCAIANNRYRTLKLLLLVGATFSSEVCYDNYPIIHTMSRKHFFSILYQHMHQPRSLQDLATLRIRTHLSQVMKGRSIFEAIDLLPLPIRLKDVVKLKHFFQMIDAEEEGPPLTSVWED